MEKVLKNKTLVKRFVFFAVMIVLAVIDRFTKLLAVEHIKPRGSVPLIVIDDTEWLDLTYCENTGMSFSLLEGQRFILIAIPVILIIAVIWVVFTGKLGSERTDVMISLACLAGGGLGNLIDRVMQGYVVDFIDVRIINFAIFNFADICAVCGGIYFGVTMLIAEVQEDKAKKAAELSENTEISGECGEENKEENKEENDGEAADDGKA